MFHQHLPGFIKAEMGRSVGGQSSDLNPGERTPTRPKASDRITLGSHGNSAFQPITASCKIVPQGQPPSPAESPGKSFQPITMSCKIVSGKCLHPVAVIPLIILLLMYIAESMQSLPNRISHLHPEPLTAASHAHHLHPCPQQTELFLSAQQSLYHC